jgi:hypothetical protein
VTNVPTLSVLPAFESVQLQHEPMVGPAPQFFDSTVPVLLAPVFLAQPIIAAHNEGGGGLPPVRL